MRHFLAVIFSSAVFSFSFLPVTSFAGDCNKTVMGGGCTAEIDAGVAPHMHSQNMPNAEAKTKVKANVTATTAKATAPVKAVKVSNAPGQKPQI